MKGSILTVLGSLLVAAGCTAVLSPDRPAREGVRPQVGSTVARVGMRRGPEGLARFEPRVAPRYDGGECLSGPGLDPRLSAFTMHYPNVEEAHTTVRIELDDGRLVRYMENRGLPERSPDPEVMRDRITSTPRTMVQLDYVSGEASVINWGEPSTEGVMGTVADFERSEVLGDLAARAEAVLRLCSEDAGRGFG